MLARERLGMEVGDRLSDSRRAALMRERLTLLQRLEAIHDARQAREAEAQAPERVA